MTEQLGKVVGTHPSGMRAGTGQGGDFVTCVVIGDAGAGKSEFGNRYLGESLFETNDCPLPLEMRMMPPQVKSVVVDGITRQVIDTKGHAGGNSEQIQKRYSLFFRNWKQGVNGVCVCVNGRCDRFSRGLKDTLHWACNTFGTPGLLDHICVIFTCCYDCITKPNQKRKETVWRAAIQEFLRTISGVRTVPAIPIFFVDSADYGSEETTRNMIQFHDWLSSRNPLSTNALSGVSLPDAIEEEVEEKIFVDYRFEGPPEDQYRFGLYEDRNRQKTIPYNGDQPRYSEWTVQRSWEEPAGHQSIKTYTKQHEVEEKRVVHHRAHSFFGFSRRDHTPYKVIQKTWTEQWTETTSFDGTVQTTNPVRIGEISERVIRQDRERGFTEGYEKVID
jgi:GTPase SAR1 family protein